MADKKISALTAATTPLAGTEVLPIVQGGATVKVSVDNLTTGKPVSMSNLTYTGTLTGSTGILNIGSGQVYKDASGNLGINTVSPAARLNVQQSASGNFTSLLLSRTTGAVGNEQSIVWQQNDLSNLQGASVAGVFEGATTGSLRFKTNGGSGLVENMSINPAGNVTVTTGNLVIGTSGKGIDFSADPSAAGMTSELLDDYEEGTWSPVVTSTTGSITSYTSSGTYTKVGRLVYVSMSITITNNGTGAGTLRATIPFTSGVVSTSLGREANSTGTAVQVVTYAASTTVDILSLSNTYPAATGYGFLIGFSYSV